MVYKLMVPGVTGSAHAQKATHKAANLVERDNPRLIYVYTVDDGFLRIGGAVEASHNVNAESLAHLGKHIVDNAVTIAQTQYTKAEGKRVTHSQSQGFSLPLIGWD